MYMPIDFLPITTPCLFVTYPLKTYYQTITYPLPAHYLHTYYLPFTYPLLTHYRFISVPLLTHIIYPFLASGLSLSQTELSVQKITLNLFLCYFFIGLSSWGICLLRIFSYCIRYTDVTNYRIRWMNNRVRSVKDIRCIHGPF